MILRRKKKKKKDILTWKQMDFMVHIGNAKQAQAVQ